MCWDSHFFAWDPHFFGQRVPVTLKNLDLGEHWVSKKFETRKFVYHTRWKISGSVIDIYPGSSCPKITFLLRKIRVQLTQGLTNPTARQPGTGNFRCWAGEVHI
jgi:hypothetical protein